MGQRIGQPDWAAGIFRPCHVCQSTGQSAWMMPLIALPIGLFMLLLAKKLSAYGGPVACAQRVLGAGLGAPSSYYGLFG